MLSADFHRKLTLAPTAPEDFTVDRYVPAVEGTAPPEQHDTFVTEKLGAALFAELEMPLPVPVGVFFDAYSLTVLMFFGVALELLRAPGTVV